jgi:hypothetical protein
LKRKKVSKNKVVVPQEEEEMCLIRQVKAVFMCSLLKDVSIGNKIFDGWTTVNNNRMDVEGSDRITHLHRMTEENHKYFSMDSRYTDRIRTGHHPNINQKCATISCIPPWDIAYMVLEVRALTNITFVVFWVIIPATKLHGAITQKNRIIIFTSVGTLNLT